jgi:hypothetical protein
LAIRNRDKSGVSSIPISPTGAKENTNKHDNHSSTPLCYSQELIPTMQYQIFVENQSHHHFVASVIGMPTIAVDGGTEIEAISNVGRAA